MSLVNDSLKFTSSDTQIFWYLFAEKMWVAFAVQKLLKFFQQKISEYCVLNPLKQLTKWPLTSSLSWRCFEQPDQGCQMPYFVIVKMLYITLYKHFLDEGMSILRHMEPLRKISTEKFKKKNVYNNCSEIVISYIVQVIRITDYTFVSFSI